MPWIRSADLQPPLTSDEKHEIAEGRSIVREVADGIIVVCPRSVTASYGVVSGEGITYGPNGEDAFFHHGGRLGEPQHIGAVKSEAQTSRGPRRRSSDEG